MYIQELELFQRLPSHIINEVAKLCVEESYPAEHVLFRKGEDADYLYLLEDGQVAVTVEGEKKVVFPITESGAIFGWSALVEPRKYTASAEFVMDSKVMKLDGERMLRLFERYPAEGLLIMRRLAGVVAARLLESYQRLSVLKQ
ncbi:MAG: cyclic nucleotide-binding domain-containing protein [Desulforhabdus sp.]|jgi:CRP-like cAMP-binding protein|nr:cyclic nucleotide-binding domain-containing protein [Desulforhabdus sp.]